MRVNIEGKAYEVVRQGSPTAGEQYIDTNFNNPLTWLGESDGHANVVILRPIAETRVIGGIKWLKGETRKPKAGEWFTQGTVPELADHDFELCMTILTPVEVVSPIMNANFTSTFTIGGGT